jgi:transcriptional regulator with XRE-family HTH domain
MATANSRFEADKDLLVSIAKIIKTQRKLKRLTQEELSERSGIHWRYLQEIEAGTNINTKKPLKNISISMFFAIAKGLSISPESFLKLVTEVL